MSAKGSTWKTHKYTKKVDGKYYYKQLAEEFEAKVEDSTSKLDKKSKKKAAAYTKEVKAKIKNVQNDSVNKKVTLKITVPEVKLSKPNISRGLKTFNSTAGKIAENYWDFSKKIGKKINSIIRG